MTDNKKDMSELHDLPHFADVVKNKNGVLRNLATNGRIDLKWAWNDQSALDQVFALKIPINERDKNREYVEAYIDWQELYHYLRSISLSMDEVKQRIQQEMF